MHYHVQDQPSTEAYGWL